MTAEQVQGRNVPLSYTTGYLNLIADTGGLNLTMVGLGRLELPTSRLSSARSNQLSYRPPGVRSLRDQIIRDQGSDLTHAASPRLYLRYRTRRA